MPTLTKELEDQTGVKLMAYAEPDGHSIIDLQNPATGRSQYADEDLETMRKRYPLVELVSLDEWCAKKAALQDRPIVWNEVTEERYWDALEVLPPAAMHSGAFLLGEPEDHHAGNGRPRYSCYFYAKTGETTRYYSSNRPVTTLEFVEMFCDGKPRPTP